jgi:hypothetical protein
LRALAAAGGKPLTIAELREACHTRNATIFTAEVRLIIADGLVTRLGKGGSILTPG